VKFKQKISIFVGVYSAKLQPYNALLNLKLSPWLINLLQSWLVTRAFSRIAQCPYAAGLARALIGQAVKESGIRPFYISAPDKRTPFELIKMVGRTEKWITMLMDGLSKNVDDKTAAKILEQCGRQCQSQGLIKKARNIYQKSKGTDDFLDKLGQTYKHLHREGNKVYLIYPKCYCSQVNKISKGKLPGIYCNCSRGWAKALFEGAIGKPVEVIMEKSIINGDDQCKFKVML
jgi:hypothetical protein